VRRISKREKRRLKKKISKRERRGRTKSG